MRKRNKSSGGGVDPNAWLNTYGDLVTLLLCFFVMLFTMSSVDAEKWQILMKAFTSRGNESSQIVLIPEGDGDEIAENMGNDPLTPPGEESIPSEDSLPIDFDDLFRYIKAYVERNNLEGSVEVQKTDNSVFIRFKDNIFFNPDSAVLKTSSHDVLEFLGDCFKSVEDQILSVRINGHTAAIPWNENYQVSDRTLSTDRANSVLMYFEEVKKIDPTKLIAIGYGKNFPVADNETPEGREKNRRVDMMILSNEAVTEGIDDLYNLLLGSFDIELYPDELTPKDVLIPETPEITSGASQVQEQVQDQNQEQNQVYDNVSPYAD